jgi:hypothetical protein
MALRELLSSSQREALEAVPLDRAGLIEHYVLSDQDLSLIRRRRGAQNRLRLAVQLALLRYPGRALLPGETPPAELLTFVARQLGFSAGAWASYAERVALHIMWRTSVLIIWHIAAIKCENVWGPHSPAQNWALQTPPEAVAARQKR